MATRTKRKTNTALVYNPAGSRRLSLGGSRSVSNPRKRRRARPRRRNPVQKTVARRNPSRSRRINPITSISGLVTAAVMAGVGVSLFDVVVNRVAPASSGLLRTGIKAGSAWAIANYGGRIPLLGKYKQEIALVLLTSAAIDVMKVYVLPLIAPVLGGFVSAAPLDATGDDGSLGNIYGNAPLSYPQYG